MKIQSILEKIIYDSYHKALDEALDHWDDVIAYIRKLENNKRETIDQVFKILTPDLVPVDHREAEKLAYWDNLKKIVLLEMGIKSKY